MELGNSCIAAHGQILQVEVSNGDQAGSEAKPGVGTRCSFRPVISTV
jgi:hypothetical protein